MVRVLFFPRDRSFIATLKWFVVEVWNFRLWNALFQKFRVFYLIKGHLLLSCQIPFRLHASPMEIFHSCWIFPCRPMYKGNLRIPSSSSKNLTTIIHMTNAQSCISLITTLIGYTNRIIEVNLVCPSRSVYEPMDSACSLLTN